MHKVIGTAQRVLPSGVILSQLTCLLKSKQRNTGNPADHFRLLVWLKKRTKK
jgi:hypothetical protein